MFTGLIECMGTVTSVNQKETSIILGIRPDIENYEVIEGGSVAVDGACLTVEKKQGSVLYFAAVRETLIRTTLYSIKPGARVNCERAVQVGSRLEGHMVLGHVDGTGSIVRDNDVRGSLLRTIRVPSELSPFMAEKGSVSVDGISLTIADTKADEITISLIPASLKKTTMCNKKCGDSVNLECDVLARYLHRIVAVSQNSSDSDKGNELMNSLERLGF